MRILVPILLIVCGICSGVGAGYLLRDKTTEAIAEPAEKTETNTPQIGNEYVKLNNQFVVPVISDTVVASMVLISLSLEVSDGKREDVFAREPKLRDALLQVMFDHANIGGFAGAFTNSGNLEVLKRALLETSRTILGDYVSDVLILDIARQEM